MIHSPYLKPCRALRIGERPFSYQCTRGAPRRCTTDKTKGAGEPLPALSTLTKGSELNLRPISVCRRYPRDRVNSPCSGTHLGLNGNAGVPKLRHSIIALERSPRRSRNSQYVKGRKPTCQTSGAFFAVDIARHSGLTAGRVQQARSAGRHCVIEQYADRRP